MKNLVFVLLVTLFAVSACGQKGSLYIQESESDAAVSEDSTSEPAGDATSEEDETETASE
jgi:predicted small lipoprotein YifL